MEASFRSGCRENKQSGKRRIPRIGNFVMNVSRPFNIIYHMLSSNLAVVGNEIDVATILSNVYKELSLRPDSSHFIV